MSDISGAVSKQLPKIAVAICTRQRPIMLQECMGSVLSQLAERGADDCLFIIENDVVPSCEDMVKELASEYPEVKVVYYNEQELGIPMARNRALQLAMESGADWMAFLDDDSTLTPGWLSTISEEISRQTADALHGPIRQMWPADMPMWLRREKKKTPKTGARIGGACTNNILIRLDWLRTRSSGFWFNADMRFSGGEDTDFFRRARREGMRIIWINEAVVCEKVVEERTKLRWFFNRSMKTSTNSVIISYGMSGKRKTIKRYIPKVPQKFLEAIVYALAGLLVLPFNRFEGMRNLAKSVRTLGSSIGYLRGLLRKNLNPYKTIEGY
ncbi:glycosyltransferase family 2 protein [Flexibacterium corallicola]|uniref:glycosyltransferase family 2 protein n=1 Tax=Flexibacterium corallicola TaxID=3037259 RepID=UPI00286F1D6F|nr:glycosyltransferase [Pseudovibrio sp. M1P-2-3]